MNDVRYDEAIQALYDGMPVSQLSKLEIVEAYIKDLKSDLKVTRELLRKERN